jgi:hypothetical protein
MPQQEKPKKKLVKVNKPSNRVSKPKLKMKRTLTPMMKKTPPKSFYRVSEPLGKSPTPSSDL